MEGYIWNVFVRREGYSKDLYLKFFSFIKKLRLWVWVFFKSSCLVYYEVNDIYLFLSEGNYVLRNVEFMFYF